MKCTITKIHAEKILIYISENSCLFVRFVFIWKWVAILEIYKYSTEAPRQLLRYRSARRQMIIFGRNLKRSRSRQYPVHYLKFFSIFRSQAWLHRKRSILRPLKSNSSWRSSTVASSRRRKWLCKAYHPSSRSPRISSCICSTICHVITCFN